MHLVWNWTEPVLTRLLGLDRASEFLSEEPEHVEVLAWVSIDGQPAPCALPEPPSEWFGRANRLSREQVAWPIIEEAMEASAWLVSGNKTISNTPAWGDPHPPSTRLSIDRIVRQRRSAVDYDGQTRLSLDLFLDILDLTLPRTTVPPFNLGLGPARVHLMLFVHRVDGIEPGIYAWVRQPSDLPVLRAAMHAEFTWHPVASTPEQTPLYRLLSADVKDFARAVSCNQDIAADSAFSLGMLAAFDPILDGQDPATYRHLFWETGMIGQMLYLGAEAAGVRGTGIGCFFDDAVHRALGLADHAWQSLYHFTIGGPVDDPRLITLPPYAHLATLRKITV
jgi:nitroreductase